jgi:hypothetical protein
MATRPLDAAFGGSTTKKSKKRGAILAVGIVAGLASIGSIFAASVSINGNQNISFTQGTTTIAACDPDGITAALGAFYSGSFQLDTITLDDVHDDCNGKTLTLDLYEEGTKLATVTGKIKANSSVTVAIGTAEQALATGTVANGSGNDVLENSPSVTYFGDPEATATTLAANADRIVIEIN